MATMPVVTVDAAAALAAARAAQAAIAWGPMPDADEVRAHAGAWMRRGGYSPDLEVWYLRATEGGAIFLRRAHQVVEYTADLVDRHHARWRPLDGEGLPVERRARGDAGSPVGAPEAAGTGEGASVPGDRPGEAVGGEGADGR